MKEDVRVFCTNEIYDLINKGTKSLDYTFDWFN